MTFSNSASEIKKVGFFQLEKSKMKEETGMKKPNLSEPRIAVAEGFTESQNGQDWKGPVWSIWSNPPAEAGSPTAGCTGPRTGGS